MQLISGGFYVTRFLEKPAGLDDILPDRLLTLSSCLTEFLPDAWAFRWASDPDSEAVAALGKLGLSPDLLPIIRELVDSASASGELGWPNVWQSLPAAKAVLAIPGIAGREFHVFELGVPEDLLPSVLDALAPTSGAVASGLFTKLSSVIPLDESGTPLGWELLGVEDGGSCHSWLCNGIQKDDAVRRLGIQPGSLGLLQSEQHARAVDRLIQDGLGAEPVPWFPGYLSQIKGSHSTVAR